MARPTASGWRGGRRRFVEDDAGYSESKTGPLLLAPNGPGIMPNIRWVLARLVALRRRRWLTVELGLYEAHAARGCKSSGDDRVFRVAVAGHCLQPEQQELNSNRGCRALLLGSEQSGESNG